MRNIRLVRGVLVALAVSTIGLPGMAAGATKDAIPTFYLSKLPLDKPLTAASKASDEYQFYCQSDLRPVGDDSFTAPKPALTVCGNDRLLTTRNDTVEVDLVVLNECPAGIPPDAKLKIDEKARKSVLGTEVSTIVTALASRTVGAAPAAGDREKKQAEPPVTVCVTPLRYVLQDTRANATLSVTFDSSKDNPTYKVITGPPEHWFITGDAIVRGVKELKYDPDSKTVVERDKPSQFYVGFNYMVGDVLTKYPQLSGRRTVLKLMLSPTKNPFDSIGVGLGYRLIDGAFKPINDDDKNPSDISGGMVLFVGHFWSKNDKVDATTGAVTQSGRSQSWRVGLSYDVSSLLGWLN